MPADFHSKILIHIDLSNQANGLVVPFFRSVSSFYLVFRGRCFDSREPENAIFAIFNREKLAAEDGFVAARFSAVCLCQLNRMIENSRNRSVKIEVQPRAEARAASETTGISSLPRM